MMKSLPKQYLVLTIGITWLVIGIIYGAIKSRGYKVVPEAFRNVDVA